MDRGVDGGENKYNTAGRFIGYGHETQIQTDGRALSFFSFLNRCRLRQRALLALTSLKFYQLNLALP